MENQIDENKRINVTDLASVTLMLSTINNLNELSTYLKENKNLLGYSILEDKIEKLLTIEIDKLEDDEKEAFHTTYLPTIEKSGLKSEILQSFMLNFIESNKVSYSLNCALDDWDVELDYED